MKLYVNRFRVTTNGEEFRIEKKTDCGFPFPRYEWHEYPILDPYYFTDRILADKKCKELEEEAHLNWRRANLEWKEI